MKTVRLLFLSMLFLTASYSQENTLNKESKASIPGVPSIDQSNKWYMLDVGGYGGRNSVGVVYLPEEKSFLLLGGTLAKGGPYSEVTFNMKESRWENRFPIGKEGLWGDVTGPSKAPARGYGGNGFEITEGVLRPHLDFGYNQSMELWGNAAYDKERGKVIVPFHRLFQTYEYDPKARTWQLLESANNAPYEFWDDIVYGGMYYDNFNKEIVAGQGRWVLKNGAWEKIKWGSEVINGIRKKFEIIASDTRVLVGATRARFNLTESEQMSKSKLEDVAKEISLRLNALIVEINNDKLKPTEYEKKQLVWANQDAKLALDNLNKSIDLLKTNITKEAIAIIEDAWECLDDVNEDLAVIFSKRAYCRFAVDEKQNKIVLFGGNLMDRIVADTWVYDCKSRSWEQARPKISPSPRYGHGLVWLPKSQKILLVDGAGKSESWIYDIPSNEWSLLDEGGAKRASLTSNCSTWGWKPEPSVSNENDFVITISNRNESKVPRFSTWGAQFDVTKIDVDGTKKLGVAFRKEEFVGGNTADPRWYDQNANETNASKQQAWLNALPLNTWMTLDRKEQKNNPDDNRAWGTTIYDPDHDQFLQWGGGHVAYTGNSVLHYSMKSNQFYIGHRPEFGLAYAAGQGGMPVSTSYRNRAFVPGHAYHNYGYDVTSGLLVICGQTTIENTTKQSLYFGYDPAKTEWLSTPIETPFQAFYGMDRLCTTPKGLIVWAQSGGIWRLDASALKWVAMPLSGEKLPGVGHEAHGLVYDEKADRVLLFSFFSKGEVYSYDMKSGVLTALNPIGKGTDKKIACRELVYLSEGNAVLIAAPIPDSEGKLRWPLYDCEKNEWKAILLNGTDPVGKEYSVSIGLMYDKKRQIVWAADHRPNVSALKIDLKTANIQPLDANLKVTEKVK